ncbi:MAG: glycoside hydrolase family 18 protein [Muribaculaceae bacterium]|nr:glycoside hydrolase family 18 protein [Muribaculaceae bacterium]
MMKRVLALASLLAVVLSMWAGKHKDDGPVVAAYVTGWHEFKELPDCTMLTHINYAFGNVNKTYDGVTIQHPERLRQLVELKKDHKIYIVLSIGGWTAGGFSEMASTDRRRKAFAKDCKRIVKEYNLDGIDIDWEYPSCSEAGISSSPADIDNFTLLMKELRKALGKSYLLSCATIADARFVDFKAIEPYVDLVNIMMYDVGNPPYHHAALYRSEMSGRVTAQEALQLHLDAGMPVNKLVLGVPFYGRSVKGFGDTAYGALVKRTDVTRMWDDVAKVPYLLKDGEFVCTYEDAESLAWKCRFVKETGMRGAMYWEYRCDDEAGTLRNAVWHGIMNQ